jgi:hypothetical protein
MLAVSILMTPVFVCLAIIVVKIGILTFWTTYKDTLDMGPTDELTQGLKSPLDTASSYRY